MKHLLPTLLLTLASNALGASIVTPASSSFSPAAYSQSKTLSPVFSLFWEVSGANIRFALKFKNSGGWAGFGIGEPGSGGMEGSDIVTFTLTNTTISDGNVGYNLTIQDRYSLSKEGGAVLDTVENITPIAGYRTSDGGVVAEFSRTLGARDLQDRAILAGKQNIIWAWGEGTSVGYHGVNRGAATIVFIEDDTTRAALAPSSDTYFELTLPNIQIPAVETAYWCHSATLPPSIGSDPIHITDIEFFLPNDTTAASMVHHILIYSCYSQDPYFNQFLSVTNDSLRQCYGTGAPEANCHTLLYAWTPGANKLVLPPAAGYRSNDAQDVFSVNNVLFEMHYNNPSLLSGFKDNSVLRIGYTKTLRSADAGSLVLGDGLVVKYGEKIQSGVSSLYSFLCPSACTTQFNQPINVFGNFLHAHMTGKQLWIEHKDAAASSWDNATTVVPKIDFYKFDFQQTYPMNMTVNPGDEFLLHCVYRPGTGATTQFGLASSDEMCQAYLFYYPRIVPPAGALAFRLCSYSSPESVFCGDVTRHVNASHPNLGNAVLPAPTPAFGTSNLVADVSTSPSPTVVGSFALKTDPNFAVLGLVATCVAMLFV